MDFITDQNAQEAQGMGDDYARCLHALIEHGHGLPAHMQPHWDAFEAYVLGQPGATRPEPIGDILDYMRAFIGRDVYKFSKCGAWVRFEDDESVKVPTVIVGSIVEGSERSTQEHRLEVHDYQTPAEFRTAFYEALDAVEKEADAIWVEEALNIDVVDEDEDIEF